MGRINWIQYFTRFFGSLAAEVGWITNIRQGVTLDHRCRISRNNGIWMDILRDHRPCAYAAAFSNRYPSNDDRMGSNPNLIFDSRIGGNSPIAVNFVFLSQGDSMKDSYILADNTGWIYHQTPAMGNAKTGAYLCPPGQIQARGLLGQVVKETARSMGDQAQPCGQPAGRLAQAERKNGPEGAIKQQ
jgi:hypothetical protein